MALYFSKREGIFNQMNSDFIDSPVLCQSLLDISAKCIVKDVTQTLQAMQNVPIELRMTLMKAALQYDRDCVLPILVRHWPEKSLSLKQQFKRKDKNEITHDHLQESSGKLLHAFIYSMRTTVSSMKLKYLDLTGYPIEQVMIKVLCDFCASYCKDKMKENLAKTSGKKPESQSTNDRYVVKCDVKIIGDDLVYLSLCKALKLSDNPECPFKVQVVHLDICEMDMERISVLLSYLNPMHLQALRLCICSLNNAHIKELASNIGLFSRLTSLDLSLNTIQLHNSHETTALFGSMLSKLTSLKQLDLTNNRLSSKLHVLNQLPSELHFLKVSGCCLREDDVRYLAYSHHASGLTDLDLSGNTIMGYYDNFCNGLKAFKELMVLDIERCGITECEHLFQSLSVLPNLEYLNIAVNKINFNDVLHNLAYFSGKAVLQVMKVSYWRTLGEDEREYLEYVYGDGQQEWRFTGTLNFKYSKESDQTNSKLISVEEMDKELGLINEWQSGYTEKWSIYHPRNPGIVYCICND